MRRSAAEFLRLGMPLYVRNAQRTGPEAREFVEGVLRGVLKIAESYEQAIAANAEDPDLSEQGREKARRKAAHAALHNLAAFEQEYVAACRRNIAQLEQGITQRASPQRPTDPAERLAYELRQREIRDQLRALDPEVRDLLYLQATDPEVLDAIESAPPTAINSALRPFVNPERKAAAVLERARAAAPALAAGLEHQQNLAQIFTTAINSVREVIVEDAPGTGEAFRLPGRDAGR